jgi:hypothetical protein
VRNGPKKQRPPYLPDGYRLDEGGSGLAILRREDGSEAAFGERASVEEVERAAWEDRRKLFAPGSRYSCIRSKP